MEWFYIYKSKDGASIEKIAPSLNDEDKKWYDGDRLCTGTICIDHSGNISKCGNISDFYSGT